MARNTSVMSFDLPAGPLLESRDQLRDRSILFRVPALLLPHDEIGRLCAERR
jgi:hypothetical protein